MRQTDGQNLQKQNLEKQAGVQKSKPATSDSDSQATQTDSDSPTKKQGSPKAKLQEPAQKPAQILDSNASVPIQKQASVPISKQASASIQKQASVPIEKQTSVPIPQQASVSIHKQVSNPVQKQDTSLRGLNVIKQSAGLSVPIATRPENTEKVPTQTNGSVLDRVNQIEKQKSAPTQIITAAPTEIVQEVPTSLASENLTTGHSLSPDTTLRTGQVSAKITESVSGVDDPRTEPAVQLGKDSVQEAGVSKGTSHVADTLLEPELSEQAIIQGGAIDIIQASIVKFASHPVRSIMNKVLPVRHLLLSDMLRYKHKEHSVSCKIFIMHLFNHPIFPDWCFCLEFQICSTVALSRN